MIEAVIDIETLSTNNNALILTIGAIKFKRNEEIKELKKMDTFYSKIIKKSCLKLGMHIDENTLEWWKKQPKESQYEALHDKTNRIEIKDALIKLSDFLKDVKCIWANSPNFDCVILENAYKSCELDIPWNFWQLRCCRTLYDIAKVNLNTISVVSHNSLEDCYRQLIGIKKSCGNLKL